MILALGVGFIIHAERTEGNVVPIRTHNSNDFVIICAMDGPLAVVYLYIYNNKMESVL
jgi:hypothetical protein